MLRFRSQDDTPQTPPSHHQGGMRVKSSQKSCKHRNNYRLHCSSRSDECRSDEEVERSRLPRLASVLTEEAAPARPPSTLCDSQIPESASCRESRYCIQHTKTVTSKCFTDCFCRMLNIANMNLCYSADVSLPKPRRRAHAPQRIQDSH